jgi:hypothetical protein
MSDGYRSKFVVLDGGPADDVTFDSTRTALLEEISQHSTDVQVFTLRSMKLAHCIGCFGCWTETPGICRYHEQDGVAVLQAVIHSDITILLTPISFGGYSAETKQIVDRFVSLLAPYFQLLHGEVHHVRRYARYPRLVAVGVQSNHVAEDARIFKLVAGRNAVNLHAASYAADVVRADDTPDTIRAALRSALSRHDPLPWAEAIRSLVPAADPLGLWDGGKQACLIVGSPKTLTPSTSAVLGGHVLKRLQERGWQTETLTLTPRICRPAGQTELLDAADRANLLLFAFPLYVDALPFLMVRALELIADHHHTPSRQQRLVAIANNGFPEAYQNYLALAMCRRFAHQTGIRWAGGLALGGGEGLIGGQPLQPRMGSGLPATHVISALETTAAALARGDCVPAGAVREMARNPIPFMPLFLWRRLFIHGSIAWWDERAAAHGVGREAILARPYESNLERASVGV